MSANDLYESPKIVAFVLSEGDGFISRENAVVTQTGTALKSGTILAQVDTGTAAFAMDSGATGNPTAGTITVGAAALPGVYVVEFTAATKYDVEDPNGVRVGSGTLGSAFSKGGLGFTLTAGGTAAVAGDTAKITVATGTGKYVAYTASAAAGPAAAILYEGLPAKTGDSNAVVFTNDCEVNRALLTGLDATAEANLKALRIKVRGQSGLPYKATPAL